MLQRHADDSVPVRRTDPHKGIRTSLLIAIPTSNALGLARKPSTRSRGTIPSSPSACMTASRLFRICSKLVSLDAPDWRWMCLSAATIARVWLSCTSWVRAERSSYSVSGLEAMSTRVRLRTDTFVSGDGSEEGSSCRGRTAPKAVT